MQATLRRPTATAFEPMAYRPTTAKVFSCFRANHHSQSASVNEELLDWVSMGRVTDTKSYDVGEDAREVLVVPLNAGEYEVSIGDNSHHLVVTDIEDHTMTLEVDGLSQRYHYQSEAPATLYLASDSLSMMLADNTRIPPEAEEAAGGGTITAPMHGRCLFIVVDFVVRFHVIPTCRLPAHPIVVSPLLLCLCWRHIRRR